MIYAFVNLTYSENLHSLKLSQTENLNWRHILFQFVDEIGAQSITCNCFRQEHWRW